MAYIGKTPASAALTSSDISDGIITSSKIANGGVETVDIADANVTAAKLASGTVQNQSAFKNTIINGDMSIAQRATSLTGITGSGYKTLDRYQPIIDNVGTWTQSQSTDVPTGQGFAKSFKFDCTTAKSSLSSTNYMINQQRIESQNLQYLKKGTSSAESTTLSFWVKATKTGTNICEIRDVANNRTINKSYTISNSNTWEKKIITFAGDTSGALPNTNGSGLYCSFWLAAGSNFTSGTLQTSWGSRVAANRAVGQVNHADSTSNDWYVTGIQMEAGTSASDFEFLPVDVNLKRCQRYFQKSYNVDVNPATSTSVGEQTIGGGSDGGGNISVMLTQHGEMRSAPTIVGYAGGTSGSWGVNRNGASGTGTFNTHRNGQHSTSAYAAIGAGWTVGWITGHFTMSSEL